MIKYVGLIALMSLTGCAKYVEVSSPCKRPANLSAYVESSTNCGPADALNTQSVDAILDQLKVADE